MKKDIAIYFILVLFSLTYVQAQDETYVPDNNFEQALIDLGYDDVLDDYVYTDSINTIKDLIIFNKSIKDLTGIEGFVNLETLNCSNNLLTSLNIGKNINLIELDCSSNAIEGANLNITNNTSLEKVNCSDNSLISFNSTENPLLEVLDLSSNQIQQLNLVNNDSLISFKASNNRLLDLNVDTNKKLEELFCSNNQIKSLVISENKLLRNLLVSANQLSDLVLVNNDSLRFLDITENQIKSIDLTNNKFLTNLTAAENELSALVLTENDSLTIVGVSDNQLKSIDISANLKLEYLIVANNQLSVIDFSNNISLKEINLSSNLITAIDSRLNDSLKSIDFSSNQLKNIDLSKNLLLERLNVNNNHLSELDLSVNDSIGSVIISNNKLTKVNLNNNNNGRLATLVTTGNKQLFCIQIDDISQIGVVWIIDDHTGYIDDVLDPNNICTPKTFVPDDNFERALIAKGIDASGVLDNYVLTSDLNTITELEIVGLIDSLKIQRLVGLEDFTALSKLNCSNNLIVNLDISSLTNLSELDGSNNLMKALYLKNTNLAILDASNNANLSCIVVDDIDSAINNTDWTVDDANLYKLECDGAKTFVPDDNFEQALIELGLDIGPLDDYVYTDNIAQDSILLLQKKNIFDLTGVESFSNLKILDISENNLTALDISNNLNLIGLVCFSNHLAELNVTKNTALSFLNCGNNELDTLNVSLNPNLLGLACDNNNLTDLDLENNLLLARLDINSNNISNQQLVINNLNLRQLFGTKNDFKIINIAPNTMLIDLDFSDNHIENINLSQNIALKKLSLSNNLLTNLDLENNDQLEKVNANSNNLKLLEFNNHSKLDSLSCSNNQIQGQALEIGSASFLKHLYASDNEISNINSLTLKDSLRFLDLGRNKLQTIDVGKNTKLIQLYVEENMLDNLNLTTNVNLELLKFSFNQLNEIDLSSNSKLSEIEGSNNNLSSIDLVANFDLRLLNVDENKLESLELSSNFQLEEISGSNNLIKDLDLTLNTNLTSLKASSNELQSINLKNGNNTDLRSLFVTSNPDLSCIQVDDSISADSNKDWFKDAEATYNENCRYTDTYVPDDNFENALADITGVPDDNDDYIPTASIENLETLDVSSKNIIDLTGIEDLLSIKILNLSNNNIDSLDLSNNESLEELWVSTNLLDTLDLSNNKLLKVLDLTANKLRSMDTDSLTALTNFIGDFNQFSTLNFKNNGELTSLSCASNQLTSLILNNGKNDILITFNAIDNPSLNCIQVDAPNLADQNTGWQKDDTASYNTNCHYNETYIPDDNFEQALINAGFDYEGVTTLDDYIPNKRIETARDLNLRNKGIEDLTGLEAFVNLVSLNINSNIVSTLDISNNLKLEKLYCNNNLLANLDLSNNNLLKIIDIASNLLTEVDVSTNILLNELNVDKNNIENLNLQNNSNLKTLDCSYTKLSFLDLANNGILGELTATHNDILLVVDIQNGNNEQLNNINLTFNPNLNCILVDDRDAAINNINWIKDEASAFKLFCDDDDNDGVVNNDDQCAATPNGDMVDLFGCSIFSLPVDNFTIRATGETCRSSNNGKINIESVAVYSFQATITNSEFTNTINFGTGAEIRNLKAGIYNLCITIDEKPNYENCYEIVITEPEDLKVFSSFNKLEEKVSLSMTGATSFTIEHNDLVFQTSEAEIVLKLDKGLNTIKVKIDADCQGVYQKTIFIADDLVYYPNPFVDHMTIFLGNTDSKEVTINIYSHLGQLVRSESLTVRDRSVIINGTYLAAGIYMVSLISESTRSNFNIVKK